jgi:hypothetical protein
LSFPFQGDSNPYDTLDLQSTTIGTEFSYSSNNIDPKTFPNCFHTFRLTVEIRESSIP